MAKTWHFICRIPKGVETDVLPRARGRPPCALPWFPPSAPDAVIHHLASAPQLSRLKRSELKFKRMLPENSPGMCQTPF